MWFEIAEQRGVEVRYETSAVRLVQDGKGRVTGVTVHDADGFHDLSARAIVLGCGGFEANPEWRARYRGRPWDHAKVRGTRYNTGDGLKMAMEIYACGEMIGGLFHTTYPGGTGLMSGAVFGRLAGSHAAGA